MHIFISLSRYRTEINHMYFVFDLIFLINRSVGIKFQETLVTHVDEMLHFHRMKLIISILYLI
jgi:hypothetical protein